MQRSQTRAEHSQRQWQSISAGISVRHLVALTSGGNMLCMWQVEIYS